ncbi:SRPBCC family protein [Reinekea sp. G2M2-21]|uniref:SRPBCC family protein n=1 Tax=Reinekea sp. G2M2-21 TaxID=2788942 RepID=UPI0018ABBE6C|nr:SRPBCC family protein [Reinekea sp. G2M2-21]
MIGWNESIEIDASAAHCYAKATDLDACAQWIPQVEGIEKLYQGEITVGSQWKETRREGKRVHTMTLEVFESHSPAQGQPPFIHCAGADMKSMKSYYRFFFDPTSDTTCRVTLEARVEPKNLVMKLLSKLMVSFMRKSEAGLLQRLKTFCEQ